MAAAHVQSTGVEHGTVTSGNLAFGSNVTAGGLLINVMRCSTQGRTHTTTDSLGNTWAQIFLVAAPGGQGDLSMHYAYNITGGACTVTSAISGGAAILRSVQSEYSGISTATPLDKSASSSGNGTALDSTATATTTQANELLVGAFIVGANGAVTAGTSFTIPTGGIIPSGAGIRCGTEYQVVSATGTYSATATDASTVNWAMGIATFKEPAGGATATMRVPRMMTLGVGA